MVKKIFKHIYLVISVFATIGGAFSFYQLSTSVEDFNLSLYLKSSDLVIKNKRKIQGLKVIYNGNDVKSLYASRIELKNTGKRALTKDYIFKPLVVNLGKNNPILHISSNSKMVTYNGGCLTYKWDLLNPDEIISTLVFTEKPVHISTKFKLKEISKIEYINEIQSPPIDKKLHSINIIWLVFIVVSLLMTIDAILLIKQDKKLQVVFDLTKMLKRIESIERREFLDKLLRAYSDYYSSVPFLFVTPSNLIDRVTNVLNGNEIITGRLLEVVRQETINYVRFANLYTTRSYNLIIGPLLFGVCFIRVLWILLS